MSDIAQPQLHTHLEKRGKPVRLEAGTCSAADTRSRVALGYLVFRGTDRSWPMPRSRTAAKAWDAVSNPTEPQHQKTAGVNQARLPREAEKGSIPSHTTEQIERPAPLIYSDRVVPETSESTKDSHFSVSRTPTCSAGTLVGYSLPKERECLIPEQD